MPARGRARGAGPATRFVVATLVLALLLGYAAGAGSAAAAPITVLPLGDSITDGENVPGGTGSTSRTR